MMGSRGLVLGLVHRMQAPVQSRREAADRTAIPRLSWAPWMLLLLLRQQLLLFTSRADLHLSVNLDKYVMVIQRNKHPE